MQNNIKKIQLAMTKTLVGSYKNKNLILELLNKKLDNAFLSSNK